MNLLPLMFPAGKLANSDLYKVQWYFKKYVEEYYSQYGYGHFLLAAYASVPTFLTPDLLYKIWQNFNAYKWTGKPKTIHRVAVADILLSPLCREAGSELYEMHFDVRMAFLEWLKLSCDETIWQRRGLFSIEQVAAFVESYHEKSHEAGQRWGANYVELQMLEAKAYTQPAEVAKALFVKMEQAVLSKNSPELLQVMDLVVKTRKKLEITKGLNGKAFQLFHQQAGLMDAWRSLLQENSEAFIEKLRNNPALLDLLANESRGGIEIKLPGSTGGKLKQLTERRLYVLVVSVPEFVEEAQVMDNSASLIQELLQGHHSEKQLHLTLLAGEKATRHNILSAWHKLVQAATENDDLLFYIAAPSENIRGHSHVHCYPSGLKEDRDYQGFTDDEIGAEARSARCASLTLILDLDSAATPYWLDLTSPGRIVFAAGTRRQQGAPHVVHDKEDKKDYFFFSYVLKQFLSETAMQVDNRRLFAAILNQYQAHDGVVREAPAYPDAPQLLCHPDDYNMLFLQGKNNMMALQNRLRNNAYLRSHSSGRWDDETAGALRQFCRAKSLSLELPLSQYIEKLAEESASRTEKSPPVFLFILSDSRKDAKKLESEARLLLEKLEGVRDRFVFLPLIHPTQKKLASTVQSKKYRNRIELVYYTGRDDAGNLVLRDGILTLSAFSELLPYQENIKLLVANTSRSGSFARLSTQMGVQLAIGIEDEISSREAADQCERLMQLIADGKPVDDYSSWLRHSAFRVYNTIGWKGEGKALWDWNKITPVSTKASNAQRVSSLLIGIDEYSREPLKGCVSGAMQIDTWLKQLGRQRDFDISTNLLLNKHATKAAILSGVRSMIIAAKPGDVCVIYFAGHGLNETPVQGSIAPCDYEVGGGTITNHEFYQAIQEARSSKPCCIVMIHDSETGYYKWVGENDIYLGAVRYTRQVERQFESGTASAFLASLVDIFRRTKGKITWRHLMLWLRFRLEYGLKAGDEMPVLVAGASLLDTYLLRPGVRYQDDASLLAFDKASNRWIVLPEDFSLVPLYTTTFLQAYGTGKRIPVVNGEIIAANNTLQFAGVDEGLNEQAVYQAIIGRPLLPVSWSDGVEAEVNSLRPALLDLNFDGFSKWQGVTFAQKGSGGERIFISKESEGIFIHFFVSAEIEDELNDWRLKINNLNNLAEGLQKFVRYHYLSNLKLPRETGFAFTPLSVQMHYRWKADGYAGIPFSRRKLTLTEQAFSIRNGSIEINPLELQIENKESFPVFCVICLLSANLAIELCTAEELTPLAPQTTLTVNLQRAGFFKPMLDNGLSGQVKLLVSRDPLKVDFSQTFYSTINPEP